MKIECDIRTCEETNADRLMLMCDGLSGKRQMIICFDCHHAFFGTDAEMNEETYAGKQWTIRCTDCVHEIESCCKCEGHEWVGLDCGETIECRHCDAEITQDEIEALYAPDY